MQKLFPKKLKAGSHVRIVTPARSLKLIGTDAQVLASERLAALGLKVSFGKHVNECDEFHTSSVQSRIEDLHEAFADSSVDAILTVIGGFSSNQLLKHLDWDLIRKNPKILCGYSDITALQNSIYAKAGLVTYSGPHYSTFGMRKGFDYTLEYFQKCLFESGPFELLPSEFWSDDAWWSDQENRHYLKNPGYRVIREGSARGTVVGANLCTFNLLQGTEFMPSLENSILLVEEDEMSGTATDVMVDRDVQSILHQPGAEGIQGVLIGRFQKKSEITYEKLLKIFTSKPELRGKPIIAGVDFGHTAPYLTLPVGGTLQMEAKGNQIKLLVLEH